VRQGGYLLESVEMLSVSEVSAVSTSTSVEVETTVTQTMTSILYPLFLQIIAVINK
jgi:hypothetical protein